MNEFESKQNSPIKNLLTNVIKLLSEYMNDAIIACKNSKTAFFTKMIKINYKNFSVPYKNDKLKVKDKGIFQNRQS